MKTLHRSFLRTVLLMLSLLAWGFTARSEAKSVPTRIAIRSPKNDQKFIAPANLFVTVEGSHAGNIGGILELYEDSHLVNFVVMDPIPVTTAVSFRIDFPLMDVPAGRHVLTAKANGVRSAPVHIVVKSARQTATSVTH